mgnify:CR=1 FL=1
MDGSNAAVNMSKNSIDQWQHDSSMNGSYNDVNKFKTLNRITET